MSAGLKTGIVLAAVAFAGVAFAQTQPIHPTRIRGTIESVDSDVMKVQRRSGDTVSIEVKPTLTVSALKPMQPADIKKGSFIGTAALRGADGRLTSSEVVVFPESARGSGEGHYAWDFGPQSTMTNANVDAVVDSADGRTLKLSYHGGSNEVTVPPNVPIVTFIPAARSDLTPGKQVFVIATPGASQGSYVAQRVIVEKDGVVPPM
jgi:hypothetical protein